MVHAVAAQGVTTLILVALLIWISASDIAALRIPNLANALLIVSGIALAAICARGFPTPNVIGAVAGYAVFATVGEAYFRRKGVDGLGLGDAKLLAGIGAWLGWASLPSVVAVSALSALVYAVTLKRRKLAFGPWLCASVLLHWIIQIGL